MISHIYDDTSSALLVEEKLLRILNDLITGTIDPEVVEEMIKNYIDNNGVAAKTFVYDRGGIPASSWSIQHNLNKYPQVSLIDDAGNEIEADVFYSDLNNVSVSFASPVSGKAVLV